MFTRLNSVLARFIFPVLAVTLATLLRFSLSPVLGHQAPFIIFFLAVVLCAWVGGLWAGLLSTALGGIAAWYFFISPHYSFRMDDPTAPAQMIIFSIGGVIISLLAENMYRARRKTEVSEEEFRSLFELSAVGLCQMSVATGQLLRVNRKFCKIIGYSEDELRQMSFLDFTHPDDREQNIAELERLISGEIDEFRFDKRYLRKDRQVIWAHLTSRIIRDEQGRPLRIIAAIEDVTERKRADHALRESEARLAAFLQQLPVGVGLINTEGQWIVSNDRLHRFVGDVIPSRDPKRGECWRAWDANGHLLEKTLWPGARALRGETVSPGLDMLHTASDGQELWTRVSSAPFRNTAGGITGAICVIEDIDKQKRAEQEIRMLSADLQRRLDEMQTLLEILPVGVWIGNKDCSQITGNNVAYEIFGLPPGINASVTSSQPELPEGLRILVNGEEVSPEDLPVQRVARTGQAWRNFEHAVIFPDGETKTIYGSVAPLFDDNGEVRGVLGAYMDFTERKRADEERSRLLQNEQAARAEAEAANSAKDEFLATVSHELRTPLNAIFGWARLLSMGQLSAQDASRAIETIERSAKAQAQLIEDLLDASRIISGKLRIHYEPVNLALAIEAALDTVRPAANAKSIQLRAELDRTASVVMGDLTRLQQVVWNLLANAVKFTPKGGSVEIRLESVDAEAQITVSDTGQGISLEFLPYVFERFRQADSSSTRQHGGLGLGLAIVRHLVEMHGGTVTADSAGEGQGATFTVRLPLRAVQAESRLEKDELTDTSAELVGWTSQLEGVKVLVVDDEADAREMVTAVLTHYGATVTAVASVAEALTSLSQALPDVLVSDIGMPSENGYELLRLVRALPQCGYLPAIALTAYARDEDRMEALAAGFQSHVQKPVEPTELMLVIASLVERARAARQGE